MTRRVMAPALVAALREGRILQIRAGAGRHSFIGIWVVVVDGRAFVRSWSRKPRSWWRTFLEEPTGAIRVGKRTIRVRAARIRSERIREAVDRAYLDKYGKGAQRRYALDLATPACRATTTELVPA